ELGHEAFGGVVLARELGQALESRVAGVVGLERFRPATVLAVVPDPDGPRVRIRTGTGERELRTRLLVAADGSRSLARTALGIGADEHDYGQTLVVCSLA